MHKISMFAIVAFAAIAFAGEERLPEVSLNFERPKVEILKDTTKITIQKREVILVEKIETERTNPKYNPIPF